MPGCYIREKNRPPIRRYGGRFLDKNIMSSFYMQETEHSE